MSDHGEGVSFGEDVLSASDSTFQSATSSVGCSSTGATVSSGRSTTSSLASSSSHTRKNEGGIINFFRRRSWFGFGGIIQDEKSKQDSDTVSEIMKAFRQNDLCRMEKFFGDGADQVATDCWMFDDGEFFWDDLTPAESQKVNTEKKLKKNNTPHPKKGVFHPRVLKAVRFDLEETPEDYKKRPFTPLFTSTPKHPDFDFKDDSEIVPLEACDSNTVLPPINVSSILQENQLVMTVLNKSRQDTLDALIPPPNSNFYKIFYDDTDEEEVEEEVEEEASSNVDTRVTSLQPTYVVHKDWSGSSSNTIQDQSFDCNFDTSTDSSVVQGFDCIETYIQRLDDEICAANRYARENDMARASGAAYRARQLKERFDLMTGAMNELCSKIPDIPGTPCEEMTHEGQISKVFNESCWAAKLGSDDGSFDANIA